MIEGSESAKVIWFPINFFSELRTAIYSAFSPSGKCYKLTTIPIVDVKKCLSSFMAQPSLLQGSLILLFLVLL